MISETVTDVFKKEKKNITVNLNSTATKYTFAHFFFYYYLYKINILFPFLMNPVIEKERNKAF